VFSKITVSSCPICAKSQPVLAHEYTTPPVGEVAFAAFPREGYQRAYYRCDACGHFVSNLRLDPRAFYAGDYVAANYGGLEGIRKSYTRIRAFPPERSDNTGRVSAVRHFAEKRLDNRKGATLLDIGAGLGVFPGAMKEAGFLVTAIDPDQAAVEHLGSDLGVSAIRGVIEDAQGLGTFDIIALNKVLEHVNDPVAMLRRAGDFCRKEGFIYIELPDGEGALAEGFGREEFFLDHLHVFSLDSARRLIERAGLKCLSELRLREPSSKFTLRLFACP
jgi:SAM-dependent methyltransferase